MIRNPFYSQHNVTSDGGGEGFLSSFDEFEAATSRGVLEKNRSTRTMEGTSGNHGRVSSFSNSDISEFEASFKSSRCSNFSSGRSFMSKPIHPLSTVYHDYEASTSQRDAYSRRSTASSSSSTDFADVSETFEPENLACPSADGFRCGLCERFLSHRSPYSSRRITITGTMPPSAVLSCRHVFHSECLDQITPVSHSSDPPCPICSRFEEGISRLMKSFPKFSRPLVEDAQSRPRVVCVQKAPQCNTMLVLNRNRLRKNLALKGNSIRGLTGKVRSNGLSSSQVSSSHSSNGAVAGGCSKAAAGIQV